MLHPLQTHQEIRSLVQGSRMTNTPADPAAAAGAPSGGAGSPASQSPAPATTDAGVAPPAGGSAPPAGGAPASAPAPSGDWTANFQQPIKDYITLKGFKSPEMLAESYQNFEKLQGVPKEQLLKLPTDEAAPEWGQVYERLGKPKTAAEYKLEPAKENPASPEFVEWAKKTFYDANLTAKQAEAVMNKWNELQGQQTAAQLAAAKARGAAAEGELKTAWGNAFEQNMTIAKAGAKEFGATAEAIEAMESKIGTKATLEFFHRVGSKLGEAQFTSGQGNGNFGRMSPEAAQAQINAWKQDSSFMAKYAQKNTQEYKQMSEAMRDAYPGEMSV